MNRFYIAGIMLLGFFALALFVGINSNANAKAQANKASQHIGSLAEVASRADVSLFSALITFFTFGPAWFFGNIAYGNVVAIMAIIAWINSVNGEMNLIVLEWVIIAFSLLPSAGQWYRIHFKLEPDDRDAKWCLRAQAFDWLLNTVGFYSYAMPLGVPPTGWINALIVFSLSGVVAFVVGVWSENMLHSSIIRLQWLILTPVSQRGTYVDVIRTGTWAKKSGSKKTKRVKAAT